MADIDAPTGFCPSCLYARRITSARASTFLLCTRSANDSRYPKYPRLPVIRCPGYEDRAEPPPPTSNI